MPSNALNAYKERLKEIDQLLSAHEALVRLQRAEALQRRASGLGMLTDVVDALVTTPGAGRPREVHALNSAAIALLSGHLQGFVTDLFEESATKMFTGRVRDVVALVEAAPTRGNPNTDNINKLFASLGIPKLMDKIRWPGKSNDSVKQSLRDEGVRKGTVNRYLKLWTSLAECLDSKLRDEICRSTGTNPW